MFTVIIGPDGAGKTSLLGLLKQNMHCLSVSPVELYSEHPLPNMKWTQEHKVREIVLPLKPKSRAAFFISHIFQFVEYALDPSLRNKESILVDSYWYRYYAKECLLNPTAAGHIKSSFSELKKPDLVIFLNVSLSTAFHRKEYITDYETYDASGGEDAYIAFQEDVLNIVKNTLENQGVRYIEFNRSNSLAEDATEITNLIQEYHAIAV